MKESSYINFYERRKTILCDGLGFGMISAASTDVLFTILQIPVNTIFLYYLFLIVSFICAMLTCVYFEHGTYKLRHKMPERELYMGEIYLSQYTDEQLFKDIENDKELQDAIARSKK